MSKEFREPEDLLTDESFLSWYLSSGQEGDDVWREWIGEHADRQELVDRAAAILEATRMREKPLPVAQVQRAEAALLQRIGAAGDAEGQAPVRAVKGRVRSLRMQGRWIAAACILVVLVGAMAVLRLMPVREARLASGYGQLLSQELPDGSEVTMNANSQLHYSKNWKDGVDREVWLDGEAFFHVRKTPMQSRFIVHTLRFDILVTGTKFNVVNRNGKDNVYLQQGSVTIHPQTGDDMHMVPGDFVEWEGARLAKVSIRTDSLTAWQQHQLVFDNTPLRKVAAIIEEQYGVKVILPNPSVGDSTISGIMRNDNLDVLLQALETTSDFDVVRDGETITIRASAH